MSSYHRWRNKYGGLEVADTRRLKTIRLMRLQGRPAYIRSVQGAEFTAELVMRWPRDQNAGPVSIATGKSRQQFAGSGSTRL